MRVAELLLFPSFKSFLFFIIEQDPEVFFFFFLNKILDVFFRQESFNTGDYINAVINRQGAETISSVLYPDDRSYQVCKCCHIQCVI